MQMYYVPVLRFLRICGTVVGSTLEGKLLFRPHLNRQVQLHQRHRQSNSKLLIYTNQLCGFSLQYPDMLTKLEDAFGRDIRPG